MKTVLSTLVVIAVAALSTAARSQSAGTAAQAPPAANAKAKGTSANYYPLKVGSTWHHQLDAGNGQKIQLVSQIAGTDTIAGRELARLEVSANGQKLPATDHLERTDGGVFRVRMGPLELAPPICLIKYPLKSGQTWGGEMKVSGKSVTVEGREGEAEDVQVPAGKYRAIPCTVVVSDGDAKSTNIFWFADGVGIVKQWSDLGNQSVTTELTRYEPAP
jgi:hypothetical protein